LTDNSLRDYSRIIF